MSISRSALEQVMIYHLNNLKTNNATVTVDTLHSSILKDSDGYGSATSKNIYKAVMRWTLARNGDNDKDWPRKWMDKSVTELAEILVTD